MSKYQEKTPKSVKQSLNKRALSEYGHTWKNKAPYCERKGETADHKLKKKKKWISSLNYFLF